MSCVPLQISRGVFVCGEMKCAQFHESNYRVIKQRANGNEKAKILVLINKRQFIEVIEHS